MILSVEPGGADIEAPAVQVYGAHDVLSVRPAVSTEHVHADVPLPQPALLASAVLFYRLRYRRACGNLLLLCTIFRTWGIDKVFYPYNLLSLMGASV